MDILHFDDNYFQLHLISGIFLTLGIYFGVFTMMMNDNLFNCVRMIELNILRICGCI